MDEMAMLMRLSLGCGKCKPCLEAHAQFLAEEEAALKQDLAIVLETMGKVAHARLLVARKREEASIVNRKFDEIVKGQ